MLTDIEHARGEMSNTCPRIACNRELLGVENRLKVGYGRKTALPLFASSRTSWQNSATIFVALSVALLTCFTELTVCFIAYGFGLWLIDDNNGLTSILNAGTHPLA